jgi:NADH-quinone oxidoreductase subunit N
MAFVVDSFTQIIKQILLMSTFLCLFISETSLTKQKMSNFEYIVLVLCSVLGLMLLISSNNLLSLYLSMEMQSLCLYVLATSKKQSHFSLESGMKYFVLGSLSSAFFLLGASLLFGIFGTVNFTDLSLYLGLGSQADSIFFTSFNSAIYFSVFLIATTFLFKIAAAPFHMWAPDVYEGSPSSITVFFAVVPKIAFFAVFSHFFQPFFLMFDLTTFFSVVSMLSLLIGSFGALGQTKLKRLLAYSSVTHVGYMLLAFSLNTFDGMQALFFYLIVYIITNLAIWTVYFCLTSSVNLGKPRTLADLVALSKTNPLIGLTSLLAVFSLAGIPPLVGFSAKLMVLLAALDSSLYFPVFIAVFSNIISAIYYLKMIKNLYFDTTLPTVSSFPVSKVCSLVMLILVFFLVYLFFNPTLLWLFACKIALSLF